MKKVIVYNTTQQEAYLYTSKVVDFGLSLLVAAALNELLNAYVLLRQSRYYKHKVKQRVNEALKMRNRKDEELKSSVQNRAFSETYWDSIIDACEDDVTNLRKAIKKILDNANIEDSEIFSQVEVARVLLEAAKVHFEEIIKDCYNKFASQNLSDMKGVNMKEAFKEFNVESIFKEWESMCRDLYTIKQSKVDLNKKEVSDAFIVLADKFAKGDYINECLAETSKEFPEYGGVKVVKK